MQKNEYFNNKKSNLDKIKSIFQFLKGYHLLRKLKKWNQDSVLLTRGSYLTLRDDA